MDSTTWRRAKQLFHEALGKSGAERRGFVAAACAEDRDLRSQVQALLTAHDEAGEFLASPTVPEADQAARTATTLTATPPTERPGATIGRYKLLQVIGEGGFGVVYMAEQEKPVRRRVALKIIKLGMDTKQVIARFEAERQALALMEHPNIARVLDAGATDTGRPYFVMELVKGVPITEYCDTNTLTTRERLDLFTEVCGAVQHAHQKGIIHRDIKPSNVLVTLHDGKPVPKVIDFGIAKATHQRLTEKTLFTEYGQFIGTPVYMSPEQAEMSGLDVDTRSDIYSLGVLLYELLTGTTPFDVEALRSAGYGELQRIIREEEPPKPSTRLSTLGGALTDIAKHRKTDATGLTRLVRGDLDWIVMKSLEKDRTRRYESASEFAADVGRHLGDDPVLARPPSTAYRVRKYVRKHKGGVAAASALLATLAVGMAVSTTLYFRASTARTAEAGQRALAERQSYLANLSAADASLRVFELSEAKRRLAACVPALRGWEWWHLLSKTDESQAIFTGHAGAVTSVAFSPDGKRIVSASGDRTVRVWNAESGESLGTLSGHDESVQTVAVSPDGGRIASGSWDGTARVWDASSGEGVATLVGHEAPVNSIAFTPDGKRIVTGSADKTVRVWEAATGELLMSLVGHQGYIWSIAVSPDGTRIASGATDMTIRVWDAVSGRTLGVWVAMEGAVAPLHVAFNPEGTQIISAGYDGAIRLWDAESGRLLATLQGTVGPVGPVAVSPEGDRIASVPGDNTIRLWDPHSAEEVATLVGHEAPVNSIAFGPDGEWLVSASDDGTLRLWEVGAKELSGSLLGHERQVMSVAIDAEASRIASAAKDDTVRIWDVASRRPLAVLQGSRLHGKQQGELSDAFDGFFPETWVTALRFSPDGSRIVTGAGEGIIGVWDASSGEVVESWTGHDVWVSSLAFEPEGEWFVTGSADGSVGVWHATTGESLGSWVGHEEGVLSVATSPDGERIVSAADSDSTVRVWDAASGQPVAMLRGHEDGVACVAFSPDGSRIVSGSADRTLRLWDASTGASLATLRGHDDGVSAVVFSPDGRRILSGSWDGTLRVWDAVSGEFLLALRAPDVVDIAFSPDGKWVVAGSGRKLVIWDTPRDYEPG